MSVSGVGSAPTVASFQPSQTAATNTRAADGDYQTRSSQTSQTKDSDGDYKGLNATASAATLSSNGVQAALTSLQTRK